MKHATHERRRSFRKWAMPGQRVETQSTQDLNARRNKALRGGWSNRLENIGKNNGPLKDSYPAQNRSTQFQLHKHSCVSDPMGAGAKVIPSYEYCPRGF